MANEWRSSNWVMKLRFNMEKQSVAIAKPTVSIVFSDRMALSDGH